MRVRGEWCRATWKGALLAALLPASAAAVDVRETAWGFGGTVVGGRFCPVSVLLDNPASTAWEGTVRLTRADIAGRRAGAWLEEEVYLAPFAARWVQFYVLPIDDNEGWRLSWASNAGEDPGDGSQTLVSPRRAGPRTVYLVAEGDLLAPPPGLPSMSERIFPPYPTACDGLAGVVLDHAPRWEPVREAAFLGWLRAGGRVHLLADDSGNFPRFTGELNVLSEPNERFGVGAGEVRRHAVSRRNLTRDYTTGELLAPPPSAAPYGEQELNKLRRGNQYVALPFSPDRVDDSLLTAMRQMVRPAHNWGLIHLICLAYVAAVFPGVFLIGRERRGYVGTLAVLALVIASFGFSLRAVGRRGYGEETSVRTMALVAPRTDADGNADRADVTQWADVFVTDGGDYTFAAPGGGRLYSTAQDQEAVNGVIRSGAAGNFVVDVPPFSSRAFVSRSVRERRGDATPAADAAVDGSVNVPDVRLLEAGVGADGLVRLAVSAPESLPPDTRWVALHGRRAYSMSRSGAVANLNGRPVAVPVLLAGGLTRLFGNGSFNTDFYEQQYNWGGGWDSNDDPEVRFDRLARELIARDLGLYEEKNTERLGVPPGRVRVYAVAPLPPDLHVRDGEMNPLPAQDGAVIYSFDLSLNARP